jgi:hypothetical protein
MNKIFLIICLISMIFLCSVTKAASQEHPNPSPSGRIRKISSSSEDGLLEACARIAQERGFYPAYLDDLPEIEGHLNALHKKCEKNEDLEKVILNFIFNEFKSAESLLSSKMKETVKNLKDKTLDDLQKDFSSALKS